MGRLAVVNDTHAIGYEICAWILNDLGFDVYVAGPSFSTFLPIFYHHGYMQQSVRKTPYVRGIMEFKDMPQDALFVDTMPETEQRLRGLGWMGPYLIYWLWPCWPDWVEKNFRPGKGVSVMAFNPAIGRVIREMRLCPVEFLWPPYPQLLNCSERSSFGPHVVTAIKNAQGWSNVPLLEVLRDHPEAQLQLYGGGPPEWSREIPHDQFLEHLRAAKVLFHPKPTDTPGYVVMEAVLLGVPVILGRDFLRSTEMTMLFKDGETCFHATTERLDPLLGFIRRLSDPAENRRMGTSARTRLLQLSNWSENRPRIKRLVDDLVASGKGENV